ncbi:MAG: AraC family transcriptional regulator [Luteimonas sp.]
MRKLYCRHSKNPDEWSSLDFSYARAYGGRSLPRRALSECVVDAAVITETLVDALSEILKTVKLDGAVYLNAEFTAPWCVEAGYGMPVDTAKAIGADHIVFFHCLIEGRCKARLVDGSDTIDLTSGDLVLFPHDHRHLVGSDLRLPSIDADTIAPTPGASEMIQLHYGGGGEATRFVCGYLACNRRVCRALLSALPQVMRIPLHEDVEGGWLLDLLRLGVRESIANEPGAHSILTKLSELLFAEALRRYAETLPPEQPGWLAGLRDPLVGRALTLMHRHPYDAWTVDSLARATASSRSALADRFTTLIGEPPMKYLTSHRLALAAQTLRAGSASVADIADTIGYGSEAAFARAFKREFGASPAVWRKGSRKTARSNPTPSSALH